MSEKRRTLFFSAGEPSGDLHGANLIRSLSSQLGSFEAVGYGGPEMREAGCRLETDLTRWAIMGFLPAILNLPKFWDLVSRADRYFRHQRPDAVVLIDYPGFNWWIARRAKAHRIPVFYYSPPQVWAWGRWRVGKMRRLTDHVLSGLPFETTWLREQGVNATFIGHPFFDEVRRQEAAMDEKFLSQYGSQSGPLVTILPGSRTREVEQNLSVFLQTAQRIREAVPKARFAVAAHQAHQADMACHQVAAVGLECDVMLGKTPELIRLADCCLACSGSISLELLYQTKPTVIFYRIPLWGVVARPWILKVKYITLVNLLNADELYPNDLTPYDPMQPDADRVLFPEYFAHGDRSARLACHAIEWLTDPGSRERLVEKLARLKAEVARPGASHRAAEYIVDALCDRPASVPRPHYLPTANQPMSHS